MLDVVRDTFAVLVKPTQFFERVQQRPSWANGIGAALLLGLVYSLFMSLLASGGHQPASNQGLPFDGSQYYSIARWYVPILFPVLALIVSGICHGWARLNAKGHPFGLSVHIFGCAYAAPILVLYVIPDLIIFLVLGHEALSLYGLIYAPFAVVIVVVRVYQGLVKGLGCTRQTARFVTFLAGVMQAFPASFLLR